MASNPAPTPLSINFDASSIQAALEADSRLREQLREAVRELEAAVRTTTTILRRVHSACHGEPLRGILTAYTESLPPINQRIANLASLIPPGQFYKYNTTFSHTMQDAAFCVVLRTFLEKEDLASVREVSDELGVDPSWSDRFLLQTEDYLHGVAMLISELARLSLNAVTQGNYDLPLRIAQFAKELSAGFGLLNLKNDPLRRKVDGIKYDIKKMEEVIYDLSLRGLLQTAPAAASVT